MSNSHYIGKAGQFAVMAELALRGYNVSIPEIDVGDDVFVLNDQTGRLSRIQVKTATGKKLTSREDERVYRCQFTVNPLHVNNKTTGGTHYVFAGRCGRSWRFLVMERGQLSTLISVNKWGTVRGPSRMLTVVFSSAYAAATSTRSTGIDLSTYAGKWDTWPKLEH